MTGTSLVTSSSSRDVRRKTPTPVPTPISGNKKAGDKKACTVSPSCHKCTEIYTSDYQAAGQLRVFKLCSWCPVGGPTASSGGSCLMRGTTEFVTANGGLEGKRCQDSVHECAERGSSSEAWIALISITLALCCFCCAGLSWKVYKDFSRRRSQIRDIYEVRHAGSNPAGANPSTGTTQQPEVNTLTISQAVCALCLEAMRCQACWVWCRRSLANMAEAVCAACRACTQSTRVAPEAAVDLEGSPPGSPMVPSPRHQHQNQQRGRTQGPLGLNGRPRLHGRPRPVDLEGSQQGHSGGSGGSGGRGGIIGSPRRAGGPSNREERAVAAVMAHAGAVAELSRLPVVVWQPVDTCKHPQEEVQEGDGEATCCICLEIYEPGDMLILAPCLHRYHADCIGEWVRSSGNASCPECKTTFGGGS